MAERLIYLEGKPFSLDDYSPVKAIYDCSDLMIGLVCGRQVSKCLELQTNIPTPQGPKKAIDIKIGDSVFSFDENIDEISTGKVTWKSEILRKKTLRIKTRFHGFEIDAAHTHPFLSASGDWIEASELKTEDYVRVAPGYSKHSDDYDSILSIEDIGETDCVDFTVDPHHNFIANNFITHNSVTLSNFLLLEGVSIPQFRSLYVSPSKEQTSRFSNTRFAKSLFFSPSLKKYFISNTIGANNITLRMLTNGSEFYFSYAQDDADRIRGISADRVAFDEIQDILLEAVDPVVRECMAASPYKYRTYCGTPKSSENDIEVLIWQRSTQNEWVVPCKECGTQNILGWKNIGTKYLVCSRCEKGPLDVRPGRWFVTNKAGNFPAFRIPQIALPRNVETEVAYKSVLEKQRDYSRAQFNNEVLGVSDSLGARMISLDMLKALCKDYCFFEDSVNPETMKGVTTVVAGVDWSGQSPTNVSRTAICVLGVMHDGRFRILYGKIFPTGHAIQDLMDICRIAQMYNVRILIGDSGEGMLANAQLRQKLGAHVVYGNRYAGTNAGKIKWNNNQNDPGYLSDKTLIIDQVMHCVLARQYEFPNWAQFKDFTEDVMSAYEESTQQGRRLWKHAATRPDDFLQAMGYAWLAAKVATGQVVMYQDSLPTDSHDNL